MLQIRVRPFDMYVSDLRNINFHLFNFPLASFCQSLLRIRVIICYNFSFSLFGYSKIYCLDIQLFLCRILFFLSSHPMASLFTMNRCNILNVGCDVDPSYRLLSTYYFVTNNLLMVTLSLVL